MNDREEHFVVLKRAGNSSVRQSFKILIAETNWIKGIERNQQS